MSGILNVMLAKSSFTGTTLNSADKGTNMVLSGGDLTFAYLGSAWTAVRGISSKSSGLYYFEWKVNTDNFCAVGVANSSAALNSDGSGGGSWQLMCYSDDTYKKSNAGTNTTVFSGTNVNDVLGVALNFTSGKLWFAKNGSWSGDPVAGTGEAYSGLSGTLYPYASAYVAGGTCNFGSTAFSQSVPSGYTAGWPA